MSSHSRVVLGCRRKRFARAAAIQALGNRGFRATDQEPEATARHFRLSRRRAADGRGGGAQAEDAAAVAAVRRGRARGQRGAGEAACSRSGRQVG